MEPTELFRAIRRRAITIAAMTLVFAAVGFVGASLTPSQYRATSSVFVTANETGNTQEIYQGNQYAQAAVQSYVQLVTLRAVLDPVIEKLDLNMTSQQLAKQISATAQLDTVIIDIAATGTDAKQTAEIAQAVAESLVTQSETLTSKSNGVASISMKVVSDAAVPSKPISPNVMLYTLLAALAGLAMGAVYAIIRFFADTRISGEDDLARISDLPVLGRITRFPRSRKSSSPLLLNSPHSTSSEDYRRLRTNLEFADVDHPVRKVVVTSSQPAEGKSTTSVNLALAIAEQGHSVVLVDGDLRKPSIADLTSLEGGVGLTGVLRGAVALEDAIQRWGDTGLAVLTAGAVPPNPNQLVGSAAMATTISRLGDRYEFVVIDAPPILPVTDALTLAGLSDGAIVVALQSSTRRPDLVAALESLTLVNARTLGLVLNNAEPLSKDSYYGYSATDRNNVDEPEQPAAPVAPVMPVAEAAPAAQVTPSTPSVGEVGSEHAGPHLPAAPADQQVPTATLPDHSAAQI